VQKVNMPIKRKCTTIEKKSKIKGFDKGLSIKDVRSWGGIQCGHFEGKGSSEADVHIFGAKSFEIYGASSRTKGWASVNILRIRGRRSFFVILFGHLLWMARSKKCSSWNGRNHVEIRKLQYISIGKHTKMFNPLEKAALPI